MAQQLLVQRADRSVVPALKQLAETAPLPLTKLHALWTLDGVDALEPSTVIRALSDPSRDVRTSALRLAERWLATGDATMTAAVLRLLDDQDWNVRRQLAATLGEMRQSDRDAAVATLLERHADDPVTLDAALSGLAGSEPAMIERLMQAQAETPRRTAAIAMVAASAVRSGQEAAIQRRVRPPRRGGARGVAA